MTNRPKIHCTAAGALAALWLVAVGCQTSRSTTAPSATARNSSDTIADGLLANRIQPSSGTLDAATRLNVDVCHRTSGDNLFILINIDDHAVPAHLEHGDARPGEPVPGPSGHVFDAQCQMTTAAVCPCWANMTEAQLISVLNAEFGPQQADCAGGEVYARGVNGNATEIAAIQTDMSCALRTSAVEISMTSLPAAVFGVCLAQAQRVVPELNACRD